MTIKEIGASFIGPFKIGKTKVREVAPGETIELGSPYSFSSIRSSLTSERRN